MSKTLHILKSLLNSLRVFQFSNERWCIDIIHYWYQTLSFLLKRFWKASGSTTNLLTAQSNVPKLQSQMGLLFIHSKWHHLQTVFAQCKKLTSHVLNMVCHLVLMKTGVFYVFYPIPKTLPLLQLSVFLCWQKLKTEEQ